MYPFQMGVIYRFKPYRLPYATGLCIPDKFAGRFPKLFSPWNGFVMKVICYSYLEYRILVGKKICDVEREGRLSAFMETDTVIVDKYVAFVIDCTEMKDDPLAECEKYAGIRFCQR